MLIYSVIFYLFLPSCKKLITFENVLSFGILLCFNFLQASGCEVCADLGVVLKGTGLKQYGGEERQT